MRAFHGQAGTREWRVGSVSKSALYVTHVARHVWLLQSTACPCSTQPPNRVKESRDTSLAFIFEAASSPVAHSISPVRYYLAHFRTSAGHSESACFLCVVSAIRERDPEMIQGGCLSVRGRGSASWIEMNAFRRSVETLEEGFMAENGDSRRATTLQRASQEFNASNRLHLSATPFYVAADPHRQDDMLPLT